MITFNPSTQSDLEQIKRWAEQDIDSDHRNIPPSWWLTGNGVISFRVDDSIGPVLYVRMDDETPFARLHTQFGCESEVSKKRIALTLLEGFPILVQVMQDRGFAGIIYESRSESLINFMSKLSFRPYGTKDNLDDYVLQFQERACASL